MNTRRMNKLMAMAGSFLLSNGALLLLTPERFATLRKIGWLPDQYNATIDRLAADRTTSRRAGIVALVAGLLLLATAVGRTEPAT